MYIYVCIGSTTKLSWAQSFACSLDARAHAQAAGSSSGSLPSPAVTPPLTPAAAPASSRQPTRNKGKAAKAPQHLLLQACHSCNSLRASVSYARLRSTCCSRHATCHNS